MVNLIPPRYADARSNRRRRSGWALACVAVGSVSAVTVAVSMAHTPVLGDREARLIRLQARRTELAADSVTLMEELESRAAAVELLDRVARQPDWSGVLSQVAEWSSEGAQLEQVSIRLGGTDLGFQMQVVGLSRSQEFIGGLVRSLRESGTFSKVTLGGTNRVDQSEPATFRFDIHCVVAGFAPQAEALR